MKMLDQEQYNLIFFGALKYDSVAKVSAYFKGKFVEIKECNPVELYIDGLTKAFEYFKQQIDEQYFREMDNYTLLCKFGKSENAQIPIKYNTGLPAFYIDNGFRAHYYLGDILFIKKGLDKFEGIRDERPQQEKSFPEHLNHAKNKELAEKIKQTFTTERGREIRILIEVMKEKHLISIGSRQFKAMFKSLKSYLNRDIGSYQSVQNPKSFDEIDKVPFREKLDFILSQL
jgi:transposase